MRERIQNLSPRGEFFLVISVCFGYFTVSSVSILIRGIHEYRLTVPRLLWGILIEILLASVAAWILHVRGSTIRRFGLRFSWPFLLSGIPLFLASLALFWATLWCAVSVFPTARSVTAIKMVPAAPFALFLVFALVNSLFEEIAVTGYVMSALSEQGAALSITASALIRFVYHLYQGPVASLWVLPLGLLFGAVYWRWRNLWPLIVAHTILNIMSFAAAARTA